MGSQARTVDHATLEASYEPDGKMPVSVLKRAGFIRDSDVLQEAFIRGTFGATDFMMTDVKRQTSRLDLSAEAQE